MLLTAMVGMFMAVPSSAPIDKVFWGIVGIALVAASAAAVNHIADARIDAHMSRTEHRPVARGRVGTLEGLVFSAILGISGFLILYLLVNPLTAWLNVGSWVGYALIYTLYLKRATPQNIVIGGLFGAAPPLLGWSAINNSIAPEPILLVLIIFVWTPPHFWALALDRKEEYAAVNIPMLPVTHGERITHLHIIVYTVILVIASILPYAIGMSGLLYLCAALVLGAGFLNLAVLLWKGTDQRIPRVMFRYSVIYLAALFMAMVADHALLVALD